MAVAGNDEGAGVSWRGERTTTKARRKRRVRMRMWHGTREARAPKPGGNEPLCSIRVNGRKCFVIKITDKEEIRG